MTAGSPEEVVRAFLEAERDFVPNARLGTGDLHDLLEAGDRLVAALAPQALQSELNVRDLALVDQHESIAVIRLDAFIVSHIRIGESTVTMDQRYRGPVTLRREGCEWKIAELVSDGLASPANTYRPLVTLETSSYRFTLYGRRTKTGAAVVQVLENISGDHLGRAAFELSVPMWVRLHAQLRGLFSALAPGEADGGSMPVRFAGSKTLRGKLDVDGEVHTFELEPPEARPPWWWWLRDRSTPSALLHGLIAPALVLDLTVGSWRGTALVIAVAGSVDFVQGGLSLLAGMRSSYALAHALVGGVELTGGVAFMLATGFTWLGVGVTVGSVLSLCIPQLQNAIGFRRRWRRGSHRSQA